MSATYQSRDACKKGLYLAPLDEVLMEGLEEAENMLDKGLTETDRGDTALKVYTTPMTQSRWLSV